MKLKNSLIQILFSCSQLYIQMRESVLPVLHTVWGFADPSDPGSGHCPLPLPNVHAAQPLSLSPRGEFPRGRQVVLATAVMKIILVLETSAASSSTVLGNPIAGHQDWRHSGVCPELRRLGFFSKKCWASSFIPEPFTWWFLVRLVIF